MFLFFFTRIDASEEDGSFARLLNDNHKNPNVFAKVIKKNGEDIPAFFAKHTINKGEELTYNYGGGNYCWREVFILVFGLRRHTLRLAYFVLYAYF